MKDLTRLLKSLRQLELGGDDKFIEPTSALQKDLQLLLSEKEKAQYIWLALLALVFFIGLVAVLIIDKKEYYLAFFGAQGVVFGAIVHHLYSLWKEINATKIVTIIAKHGTREELMKFALELVKL